MGGTAEREKGDMTGKERERESSRSLTHLVGQEHKSQCLPGLQWSMKPPVECNRRSLEPPYRLLTGQPPTSSLKGEQADKDRRLLRPALLAARCRNANKSDKGVLNKEPAVWCSFWSPQIETLSDEGRCGSIQSQNLDLAKHFASYVALKQAHIYYCGTLRHVQAGWIWALCHYNMSDSTADVLANVICW